SNDGTLEPVLLPGEESDTSVAFDNRLVLKVFRRVEEGVNPELEMNRFLAEKASFTHVPPFAGAIEYHNGQREPYTLAVLQGYVPNEGNAWRYTTDALGRYFERVLTLPMPADFPTPPKPSLDLVDSEVPHLVQELLGSYLAAVHLLGQRTGELHVALSSFPE